MQISDQFGLQNANNMRLRFADNRTAVERISSGLRINRSADDPSGLAISNKMRSQIGGLEMAIQNTEDGISLVRTADGSLSTISDLLMRGRDIAVRAASNALWTDYDLATMQSEVDSILYSIDQIANSVTYNTKYLINGGSGSSFSQTSQADWQAGTYNPADIDLITTPGDVKLQPLAWTTDTHYGVNAGLNNQDAFNIWLDNYVDNGDGTITVRLNIDACRAGGGTTDFRGTIQLDPSVTGVAVTNITAGTNVAYAGAGLLNFGAGANRVRATSAAGQTDCQVTFTTPKDKAGWSSTLTGGPGGLVRFYFGNTQIRNKLLTFTANGFFTDMTPTATFESSAIDTGAVGGLATFSWSATSGGGTNIQMQLYEAAAPGGPWTALGMFENGDTFTYNQRYLQVRSVMTSSGITYGSPSLHDFEIKLKESTVLQIGESNDPSIFQKSIAPIDARTAGLKISGIDITSLDKAIKTYDTDIEWQSGIVSSTDIDNLSDPGFVKISSQIATQIAAAEANNAANCYINIMSVTPLADGTYDVSMEVNMYGYDPPGAASDALRWYGTFSVSDSSGSLNFDTAWTVNNDGGTPGTVPLPLTAVITNDGTQAEGTVNTILPNAGTVSSPPGGQSWNTIRFDYGTGAAKDAFGVTFNCKPDAMFNIVWENEGLDDPAGANNRVPSGQYFTSDVYLGSTLIADNIGAGAGNTQILNRRLSEYMPPAGPTGDFTTAPVFFGENAQGYLDVASAGAGITLTMEMSTDGIGGWVPLPLAGSAFTTDAAHGYVRINATLTGTSATWTALPYTYNQSTSPSIDSISIMKNISPIDEFDNAITRVSDIRSDLGILERELMSVLSSLQTEKMNVISADSTIRDANIATEASSLNRSEILMQSIMNVMKAGDQTGQGVLRLFEDHKINPGLLKPDSEEEK